MSKHSTLKSKLVRTSASDATLTADSESVTTLKSMKSQWVNAREPESLRAIEFDGLVAALCKPDSSDESISSKLSLNSKESSSNSRLHLAPTQIFKKPSDKYYDENFVRGAPPMHTIVTIKKQLYGNEGIVKETPEEDDSKELKVLLPIKNERSSTWISPRKPIKPQKLQKSTQPKKLEQQGKHQKQQKLEGKQRKPQKSQQPKKQKNKQKLQKSPRLAAGRIIQEPEMSEDEYTEMYINPCLSPYEELPKPRTPKNSIPSIEKIKPHPIYDVVMQDRQNKQAKPKGLKDSRLDRLPKDYKCEICQQEFYVKSLLEAHKLNKHKENLGSSVKEVMDALKQPTKIRHTCQYCDRIFDLPNTLYMHQMKHCLKIPHIERKKLQYPVFDHVKKAPLPDFGKSRRTNSEVDYSFEEEGWDHKVDMISDALLAAGDTTLLNVNATLRKTKLLELANGVKKGKRGRNQIECFICNRFFKNVTDFTKHTLNVHGQTAKMAQRKMKLGEEGLRWR